METAASTTHIQLQVCSYVISFQLFENKGQKFLLPPLLEKKDAVWPSVVGKSPGEGTSTAVLRLNQQTVRQETTTEDLMVGGRVSEIKRLMD